MTACRKGHLEVVRYLLTDTIASFKSMIFKKDKVIINSLRRQLIIML